MDIRDTKKTGSETGVTVKVDPAVKEVAQWIGEWLSYGSLKAYVTEAIQEALLDIVQRLIKEHPEFEPVLLCGGEPPTVETIVPLLLECKARNRHDSLSKRKRKQWKGPRRQS